MGIHKNKKDFIEYISKKISKSELFLVFNMDEEGIHLHMQSPDDFCLVGEFFRSNPDLFELVCKYVKAPPEEGEAN